MFLSTMPSLYLQPFYSWAESLLLWLHVNILYAYHWLFLSFEGTIIFQSSQNPQSLQKPEELTKMVKKWFPHSTWSCSNAGSWQYYWSIRYIGHRSCCKSLLHFLWWGRLVHQQEHACPHNSLGKKSLNKTQRRSGLSQPCHTILLTIPPLPDLAEEL